MNADRICRVCKETKALDQFSMSGIYRKWNCRSCAASATRARYAANGELGRSRSRRQAAAMRAARIPLINAIKLERGCLDCGFNAHPAALHFDHRDPSLKEFTIAKSITLSMARLMAEIAKCDVRCANCHAIRSVTEGHLGRPRVDDAA